jgi:hypothetical protein
MTRFTPSCLSRACILTVTLCVGWSAPGVAQTAAPVATPSSPAAPPVVPLAASPIAKSPITKREECTRLPLSDIAFGRDATIAQARMRLGEYADKEAKKRGWPSYSKAAESVSCEVYIDFGPLVGTEYKCLVTASFCRKP